MAIEASFTVERSEFPLRTVFEQFSDVTIELDRVVPTNDAVIPYFWIHSNDATELAIDPDGDSGIDEIEVIDSVDGQMFVRIDWNLDHESVLTAIVNTDVTLLSGIGRDDRWTFEIRVNEQADLSAFQRYCEDHDIAVAVTQLHALSSIESGREYDLTDGQRRVLKLAYSLGYFDSPRDATQADVAAELGITRQAVSSRLQRGLRRLVASTLVTPDE